MSEIPATDAVATIGTVLGGEIPRDAIHVAVLAVQSGESYLQPGEDVGMSNGRAVTGLGQANVKLLGIVDPFLESPISRGDWFWLCIYPRQVTSLNHSWSHPDVEEDVPVNNNQLVEQVKERFLPNAKKWVQEFLDSIDGPSYETLMRSIENSSLDEKYLTINGEDASGNIPNEFWDKIELITGEKITSRPAYFSCSC